MIGCGATPVTHAETLISPENQISNHMSKKVRVTALNGVVITVSENNSEFGHVRVQQERSIYDERGWLRRKLVTALIPGSIVDLKAEDFQEGQELPGKIVIKESLTPFNKKDADKDIKIAGETGVVCRKGGKPIYIKCFYTEDANATDTLVAHDNTDEIRMAYENQKEKGGENSQNTNAGALSL